LTETDKNCLIIYVYLSKAEREKKMRTWFYIYSIQGENVLPEGAIFKFYNGRHKERERENKRCPCI